MTTGFSIHFIGSVLSCVYKIFAIGHEWVCITWDNGTAEVTWDKALLISTMGSLNSQLYIIAFMQHLILVFNSKDRDERVL